MYFRLNLLSSSSMYCFTFFFFIIIYVLSTWYCILHILYICISLYPVKNDGLLRIKNIYTTLFVLLTVINFPNMCNNIPASPAYGVCISQLIRYARASGNYSDFLKRHLHLRNRLLDQGYKKIRLIRSLKKFIFRYQYLVEIYSVSSEKIISDAFSYSENV